MLGTIVNVATVVAGSCIGLFLKKGIREDIADMMLDFVFADVEPLSYAEVLDSITFAEVEALLKEAFCPERFAMSVINPIKEG